MLRQVFVHLLSLISVPRGISNGRYIDSISFNVSHSDLWKLFVVAPREFGVRLFSFIEAFPRLCGSVLFSRFCLSVILFFLFLSLSRFLFGYLSVSLSLSLSCFLSFSVSLFIYFFLSFCISLSRSLLPFLSPIGHPLFFSFSRIGALDPRGSLTVRFLCSVNIAKRENGSEQLWGSKFAQDAEATAAGRSPACTALPSAWLLKVPFIPRCET